MKFIIEYSLSEADKSKFFKINANKRNKSSRKNILIKRIFNKTFILTNFCKI